MVLGVKHKKEGKLFRWKVFDGIDESGMLEWVFREGFCMFCGLERNRDGEYFWFMSKPAIDNYAKLSNQKSNSLSAAKTEVFSDIHSDILNFYLSKNRINRN